MRTSVFEACESATQVVSGDSSKWFVKETVSLDNVVVMERMTCACWTHKKASRVARLLNLGVKQEEQQKGIEASIASSTGSNPGDDPDYAGR